MEKKMKDPTCSGRKLNRDEQRSAFSPYKSATVLTNLQRGNVQSKTPTSVAERTVHQLAAQGELFAENIGELRDLDEKDECGYTPLTWASSYGQLSTVKLLLERGANHSVLTAEGETALHFAASSGNIHVVKELLLHGAKVDVIDHEGNTPLMYASGQNHALCAHELLKAGANFTLQNCNLDTAYGICLLKNSKQVQQVIEQFMLQNVFNVIS
jgi:ankyrin repeat protein